MITVQQDVEKIQISPFQSVTERMPKCSAVSMSGSPGYTTVVLSVYSGTCLFKVMEFTFILRWSPYKARHKIPLQAHLLMTPPSSWKLPEMNYNNNVVVMSNADGKTNIAGGEVVI